jgi:hypothetical protein
VHLCGVLLFSPITQEGQAVVLEDPHLHTTAQNHMAKTKALVLGKNHGVS